MDAGSSEGLSARDTYLALLDLPHAYLLGLLSQLDAITLATIAVTCRTLNSMVCTDSLFWQSRCKELGVKTLDGWGVQSFRELYSRLLHRYSPLLGLWAGQVAPYGALLVVYLKPPYIQGCTLVCRRLNEAPWCRPIFQVHLDNVVTCVRCQNAGLAEDPGPHSATLTLSQLADDKFLLSCERSCKQDELEILTRQPATVLLETSLTAGLVFPASDPNRPTLPEIANVDPHDHILHVITAHQCMTHFRSQMEHPAHVVEFRRLVVPAGEHPLEGIWKGTYGAHGIEMLKLQLEGGTLVGSKVTGDYNVPAGELSFRMDVGSRSLPGQIPRRFSLPPDFHARVDINPQAAEALVVQEKYQAEGQVSHIGFESPSWIDAEVLVFSNDCFGMLWPSIQSFSLFTRMALPVLPALPAPPRAD